jgi:cadmium resistance protein CadD (predicted permease)
MTNEPSATNRATKKGYIAKRIGGLAMVVGVLFAVFAGSFTAPAAILFFGGLITLIVGIARRETDSP